MVQDALADAQVLGGDFQQLVGRQELKAALEAELGDRHQTQGVVAAGGAGVGQVLRLADVDRDVLARRGVADDLTGVDLLACVDDQGAGR